jgi:hypothetical protein
MADFEYLSAIIDEMRADIKTKTEADVKSGQEDLLAKTYTKHKLRLHRSGKKKGQCVYRLFGTSSLKVGAM